MDRTTFWEGIPIGIIGHTEGEDIAPVLQRDLTELRQMLRDPRVGQLS